MVSVESKPRFSTILSWRGNDNRPSDLEFELRPYCQRLVVKSTPLSGAHLLLTSERIAVRAYYPCDLQEIREQEQKMTQTMSPSNTDEDDFDGMSGFFSSFQIALVFFIMTPMKMDDGEIYDPIIEQLDDMNSYFHRAQRLSFQHQQEAEEAMPTQKSNTNSDGASTRKSCILIFPDTESAIQNLITVADSLSQERKASKKAFLQRLEAKFFLPSSNTTDATSVADTETVDPAAIASHVTGAVLEMARILELPPEEAKILMSELGDLKTIATADDSLLETIPIDPRTRTILHSFFGSTEGKKGISRFLPGPPISQPHQRHQQHYTDSHNLASVANQLFPPQSNSLTANSGHPPPLAHSVRYPSQAYYQVPQSKLPIQQHQFFDPSMAEDYWMHPEFSQGSLFDSFDDDDDNIPQDGYTFDNFNSEPNMNGSAYQFPTSGSMEVTPLSGGHQSFGMHRSDSRFFATHPNIMHPSSVHASAFPSNEVGNATNAYENFGGQSFNRSSWSRRQPMLQTYNAVSRQNSPYPLEQPVYRHSQHFVQNEMENVATDRRQYGHPGLTVSTPWQRDNRSQHQYQYQNPNQHFFHESGFRR